MVKVTKVESPDELHGLLTFSDNIQEERCFSCSRIEWVQWIVQQISNKNPKLGVWVLRDEDLIFRGYVVAVDSVLPPVFSSVVIFYLYSPSSDCDKMLLKEVEQWAMLIGADRIDIMTKMPDSFLGYGFTKTGYYSMIKIL